jgi:hypothetical protein
MKHCNIKYQKVVIKMKKPKSFVYNVSNQQTVIRRYGYSYKSITRFERGAYRDYLKRADLWTKAFKKELIWNTFHFNTLIT